ncbi:MAG TPA: N-acetyl-gamma-glutamyl-phosphate reductase [Frankiaceae bacterium]|nr:N-acetyl-gamma-glutamyl-phosphate reductase [Frankiaceae bacterium]
MGTTAAIVGASGYAGGELVRLVLGHPSLELGPLVAATSAGRDITELHPQFPQLSGTPISSVDSFAADVQAGGTQVPDVVFLALPHGESGRIAAALPDSTVVLDLGADHRLRSPADWAAGYGGEYAGSWPYGLPELPGSRDAVRGARRIAVPGCYPTATILALAPLVAAGLVEPDDLVVVASSGTSGAGRSAKGNLLGSEVMGDLTPYKVASHQHRYEMSQALEVRTVSFTPVLAPMPRGILSTCTGRVRAGTTEADLRAALEAAYGDETFVHVLPEGRWPHTAATLGSNSCHLQVALDADAGRAVVVSALDNLVKGAAGQAVQCANLALGLPEDAGLPVSGIAP